MAHTRIEGNIKGLKSSQMKDLEKLGNRRLVPTEIINQDLARNLTELSFELNRQIAILINRNGLIDYLIVGDAKRIMLPDLKRQRIGSKRYRGLRCIHTHLSGEKLTHDDLVDLTLLRLDLMSAITIDENGLPLMVYSAYANPTNNGESNNSEHWTFLPINAPSQIDQDFMQLIKSLEQEAYQSINSIKGEQDKERAILIGVTTGNLYEEMESMEELKELALADGLIVVDKIIQKRKQIDYKYFLGKGRLEEVCLKSMQSNANILIFNQSLNPSQIKSICRETDLKVIDRTMLILDIFSRRAKNREGKIQVELAQLKYRLPRLVEKDDSLSRLTGGIGGRGPGETTLEVSRRSVRNKINQLEKQIANFRKQRNQNRSRRIQNMAIVSLVGYTNAGKSTLLNSITKSDVDTKSRMFETLAPTSRKLRLPKDEEIIINDTVGFIKDLPKDLINAFKSTLEEIELSDYIIHIVDASSPNYEGQINSVENILQEISVIHIPRITVFNKIDLIDNIEIEKIKRKYLNEEIYFISAKNKTGILDFLNALNEKINK